MAHEWLGGRRVLIGEHLRTLRVRRGWSLTRLSRQVHYSKSYLSRVENGLRPLTLELAERCDQALGARDTLARLVRDRLRSEGPPTSPVPGARPDTASPPPAEPRRAAGDPLPAQLPAVGRMWGRAAETRLAGAFLDGHTGPAVIAVDGMGGVGKTTFAVALAGSLAATRPDGALFADLGAHGPSGNRAAPEEVATGLLHALGRPPRHVPVEPAERLALVRSMLAERRVVVVLDDAAGAAQVAPLLPAAGDSLIVVTSRRRLTALSVRHGALRIPLEPLPADEAVGFLRSALGRRAAAPGSGPPSTAPDAAPDTAPDGDADAALSAVARHCGGLPLALRIAAEHLVEWGDRFTAALAGEQGGSGARLDLLAMPGESSTAVRAVFAWSYRALPPDQARAFRLLALHPGAELGVAAAAAVVDEPAAAAGRLLGELRAASLLMEVRPGRYRMHDLLRDYARERARADEPPGELAACTERVLAWYAHAAESVADVVLGRARHRVKTADAPAGCEPPRFASVTEAMVWCEAERANLKACVAAARAAGSPVAWQLPYALWPYLYLRHHHGDLLSVGTAARAAAGGGDPLAAACAESVLAGARAGLQDHERADAHFPRAIEGFAVAGDAVGESTARTAYALSCLRRRRGAAAVEQVARAVELAARADDAWATAVALTGLGEVRLALGRAVEALAPLHHAERLHRAHGSLWLQASTWTLIATAHRETGEHRQAERCYRRAIELHERTGMRAGTAHALHQLGVGLLAQGRVGEARLALGRALEIYASLKDPRERAVAESLAGVPTGGGMNPTALGMP
ncbi:ATP-binding protein [Streptomyces huiliensis]|uniref:ATP-binding protein n=1 Tax=Streptomyces huiliensis TaxID=2876027 RepID=UPI001CBCFDE4|nr:tetratricopeptide repeat protein [Streptomyces huiliensis]MBZ4322092.1 tetratricopeptide repeat protein [Streptomyces huiliensis]